MDDDLTEGQRFYLGEEYERALDRLTGELELARRLGKLGIEPEINDPRLHRVLINSIEGELPFKGQAGVLDFVRHQIEQGSVSTKELALLSLLENSSNDGVQHIASILQDVTADIEQARFTDRIEPYVEAAKNIDETGVFFFNFGKFLFMLGNNSTNAKENFRQAQQLYERAREKGLNPGTSDYASSLINQGNAHRKLGVAGVRPRKNFEKAIELYKRAREEGPDEGTLTHAVSLINQGTVHRKLGVAEVHPRENFEKAIELYKRAREEGLDEGTPSYASSLRNQGNVHLNLGEVGVCPRENFEQAKELYERARAEGSNPGTPSFGRSLMNLANVHKSLGDIEARPQENFKQAEELYKRAREEGLNEGTPDYASSLINQGNVQMKLGEIGVRPRENFEQAKELFEQAREDGLDEDTPNYAGSLINQGNAHVNLGRIGMRPRENFEEAKEFHERAREEGLDEGTFSHAVSLMNQGTVHWNLAVVGVRPRENFEQANELYKRAREEGLDEGTPTYANSLMNQGTVHWNMGKIGASLRENFEQAIELLERAREEGLNPGTPDYALSLMNQGNVHVNLGEIGMRPKENFEQAKELFEQARAESQDENLPDYALFLMNQGNVHRRLGEMSEEAEQNYAEAEALYSEARQIFNSSNDHESLRKADENLASLYLSMGEKSKAYESFKAAIESVEEVRSTVNFREHREEFFEKHIPIYYETVLLALDLGEDEEAFEYAERAKGRVFLEMLEDTRIEGDVPDELGERERELKEKIGRLRQLLRTADSQRGPAGPSVKTPTGTIEATASMDRGNVGAGPSRSVSTVPSKATETTDKNGRPDQQGSVTALTREELFKRLRARKEEHNEVLDKIRKRSPETYALKTVDVAPLDEILDALSPNEMILEYVLTDDEILIFLLDAELDYHRVSMDEAGEYNSLREAVDEYRELIEPPGQGEVSRMQEVGQVLYRILIEPVEDKIEDEQLLVVPHGPLHLLPFPALYDGENYLVEEYRIRLLANASSLRFLDEKDEDHDKEALVVGDPRGDLEHAREEARKVAELHDSEVLIGDDATKTEVQQRIEAARISHLCCHGYYDPDSPTHSSLLFAEEEMYLEEVFNLDVGSELVTLSACQTAYGDVSQGDEVRSLTRGFQYAGAPSVIGTLWRVDDERTRRFFRNFYDSEGDRVERLRQTQVAFIREDDEQSHPFYWSAFQMYGTE